MQFSKVKCLEECCVARSETDTRELEFFSDLDCTVSPQNSHEQGGGMRQLPQSVRSDPRPPTSLPESGFG